MYVAFMRIFSLRRLHASFASKSTTALRCMHFVDFKLVQTGGFFSFKHVLHLYQCVAYFLDNKLYITSQQQFAARHKAGIITACRDVRNKLK